MEFNIPVKENTDLEPIINKIIPVKVALIEPATKFMEKLLDLGIIERSYSRFNAFSHFIPKSRPELKKTEFLKNGWGKSRIKTISAQLGLSLEIKKNSEIKYNILELLRMSRK